MKMLFFSTFRNEPTDNMWQQFENAINNNQDIFPLIKLYLSKTSQGKQLLQKEAETGFFKNPAPTTGLNASRVAVAIDDSLGGTGEGGSGSTGSGFTPTPTGDDKTIINQVNYNTQFINYLISLNKYPLPRRKFWGTTVLEYMPKPTPKPNIQLAIHYKVQCYLGNYGAGKVVKTMSLLPGEKTTISIKTYKDFTQTDKHSDNVLDSFTENSADTLENMFESENSTTTVTNKNGSFGLKIPLGASSLGVGGGINRSTTAISKTINKNLSKHVEESQAQRKVEVNTETTSTLKEGEENSIVRELKNINLSRVLNFTFRQLNQEYTIVTYIDDVSLVFSNGFPEMEETVRLYEMDKFLEKYIEDTTQRTATKNTIIMSVYNLRDYTGVRKDMFTEQTLNSAIPTALSGAVTSTEQKFWGKSESFTQSVPGTTFVIPGIITQIEKQVLSTDSVIAEALLGQAEALDCYNLQLQTEAVRKEKIATVETLQEISKIDSIDINSGEIYKQVYGNCCGSINEENLQRHQEDLVREQMKLIEMLRNKI